MAEDVELPECFGNFGMTDDCFGCPFKTECEEEWEEEHYEEDFWENQI